MPSDRGSILLISSDDPFYSTLQRFLEVLGFDVLLAKNAEDGLPAARVAQPQLIILDLHLGEGDEGKQLLNELKQDDSTRVIPVIAVADSSDGEQEAWARCAGANLFLVKSYLLEQEIRPLILQINSLLVLTQRSEERRLGLVFTVLVIDDEEEMAERLRILFKDQPYRFLWAPSGQKGLRMAGEELPDLILLDLNMPGMSGDEVCRRLRAQEEWFPVPIAMLTGDARAQKEAHCLDLGADDYLLKTDPPTRLMARIRSLIRRRLGADHRSRIEIGRVSLDILKGRLMLIGQEPIALSKAETSLCTYLMSAAGKSLSRQALYKKLSNIWSDPGAKGLESSVDAIKSKLGASGDLIETSDGNYRFNIEYAKDGR